MNKAVYQKFLQLCQRQNNLSVFSSNKCPGPCVDCFAYCRVINGQTSLWIRRDIQNEICVYRHSSKNDIQKFIDGALEIDRELSLLSHEYGHFSLNNVGPISRKSVEECQQEFKIEFDTWSEGERVLKSLGFNGWEVFNSEREVSLHGYYDGFKSCFPDFVPSIPYER